MFTARRKRSHCLSMLLVKRTFSHFGIQLIYCRFYKFPPIRWRFSCSFNFRHLINKSLSYKKNIKLDRKILLFIIVVYVTNKTVIEYWKGLVLNLRTNQRDGIIIPSTIPSTWLYLRSPTVAHSCHSEFFFYLVMIYLVIYLVQPHWQVSNQ